MTLLLSALSFIGCGVIAFAIGEMLVDWRVRGKR